MTTWTGPELVSIESQRRDGTLLTTSNDIEGLVAQLNQIASWKQPDQRPDRFFLAFNPDDRGRADTARPGTDRSNDARPDAWVEPVDESRPYGLRARSSTRERTRCEPFTDSPRPNDHERG
jgi:hypothetical protein